MHNRTMILLLSSLLSGLAGLVVCGCNARTAASPADKKEDSSGRQTALIPTVDTFQVHRRTFEEQWISAGRLEASQKIKFEFDASLAPVDYRVRNGQWVRKGDTLAVQRIPGRSLNVEKASLALLEGRTQYLERLIALGYHPEDSLSIPAAIREQAALSSGWRKAKLLWREAWLEWSKSAVVAPFAGQIAGIHLPDAAQGASEHLTVMDLSSLMVSFQLLANEVVENLKTGSEVQVTVAGISGTFKAKIEEINPEVTEEGLVYVRARLFPGKAKLIPGMSASVTVFRKVPLQLVVPETAILNRQDRDLVFIWRNDSAFWQYVTVGLQNSSWVTIENGLDVGDIVISSGGFALAHAVPVAIMPPSPDRP